MKPLGHPTFWMTVEKEKEMGRVWYIHIKDGQYYTFPEGTKPDPTAFFKSEPEMGHDYDLPPDHPYRQEEKSLRFPKGHHRTK